jgi:hypothetical protein
MDPLSSAQRVTWLQAFVKFHEFEADLDDSVSAQLLYQFFADSPCQTSLSWSTDHLINADQTLLHSAATDNCLDTDWNSTDNDLMASLEFSYSVLNLLVEVNNLIFFPGLVCNIS